jgi:hypothetical protein
MSYNNNYLQPNGSSSGAQGLTLVSPILFSQIFDGTPQFYSGSTIEVQEILQITSQVIIGMEQFVDVDFKWFEPKIYYGSYQLVGLTAGIEDENQGGQGFLTNYIHKFIRRSSYQIVADPSVPIAEESSLIIDNCSFQLRGISAMFGGAEISLNSPLQNESLFQGKISRQRAPLKDATYNQFFKSIGLYYNPGCELVGINHRVQIINVVSTDLSPYPNFSCSLLGG